ncbi:MAG: methyltransferase domain-containing protein [Anaerolineales bacterium]|nr:methyltransferase domain-containing protein [Anaerolineales bacterium]
MCSEHFQDLVTLPVFQDRIPAIDLYNKAARRNRKLVQAGRVDIRQCSASSPPFPNSMFDLITSVESHYFWPDLISDMKEILCVETQGVYLLSSASLPEVAIKKGWIENRYNWEKWPGRT